MSPKGFLESAFLVLLHSSFGWNWCLKTTLERVVPGYFKPVTWNNLKEQAVASDKPFMSLHSTTTTDAMGWLWSNGKMVMLHLEGHQFRSQDPLCPWLKVWTIHQCLIINTNSVYSESLCRSIIQFNLFFLCSSFRSLKFSLVVFP